MGALAPVSSWNPEDDLLLKNAVEAGASLESLAKGAVQFSRRFNVQELQDRWNFLLYDPVVSAEASACMIEFECSASVIPSKPERLKNLGENECVSRKRKFESIHKCYYAMRKRICNEPLDSKDLSFLLMPGNNNCIGNADESPFANGTDPISSYFGVQTSKFDITHSDFPQFAMGSAAGTSVDITAHAFCTGLRNPVEDDLHVDRNSMHKQIPYTSSEDLPLTGGCSGIEDLNQAEELPVCDQFDVDDLEGKPLTIFDQINGNPGNISSGFRGSQVLNSPISDCGASFLNLAYSSPLPQIPIWCTIEGLSAPTLPDVHLSENEAHTGDTSKYCDSKNTDTFGYDVIHSDSKLKNQIQRDNMKTSTPTSDDYLVDFSNTTFNFTTEEELLFVDDDGKDGIDKSYIDSLSVLLLDSPDVNGMPNIVGTRASVVAPDESLSISGGVCPGELDDDGVPHYGGGRTICSLEAKVLPSASVVDSQFLDLCDGVICCMLNTEDPVIPCNDDVFLPNWMSSSLSSVTQLKFHELNNPTSPSAKDFSDNQKSDAGGLYVLKREGKIPEQSSLSSHMRGSHLLREMGLDHPFGDCGVNIELPNGDCPHATIMSAITACRGPNQIRSATLNANTFRTATLKDDTIEIDQAKHLSFSSADSYLEKTVHGFDALVSYLQRNASCSKQEIDAPIAIQNYQALPAELGYVEMTLLEPVVNASPSVLEELPSESDDDIPYFTDVKTMILGMDSSSDNQELSSGREGNYKDGQRWIFQPEESWETFGICK